MSCWWFHFTSLGVSMSLVQDWFHQHEYDLYFPQQSLFWRRMDIVRGLTVAAPIPDKAESTRRVGKSIDLTGVNLVAVTAELEEDCSWTAVTMVAGVFVGGEKFWSKYGFMTKWKSIRMLNPKAQRGLQEKWWFPSLSSGSPKVIMKIHAWPASGSTRMISRCDSFPLVYPGAPHTFWEDTTKSFMPSYSIFLPYYLRLQPHNRVIQVLFNSNDAWTCRSMK